METFFQNQQEFDRILNNIRKQIQSHQTVVDLHQFDEILLNFNSNFDQLDQMKISIEQNKTLIEIFDRSTQFSLIQNLEQYENDWKIIREQLDKKRRDIGKTKSFSFHFR